MASLLRPSGDYRSLLSYQKAEQIYDLTYYFAKHICRAATEQWIRWFKPPAQGSRILQKARRRG